MKVERLFHNFSFGGTWVPIIICHFQEIFVVHYKNGKNKKQSNRLGPDGIFIAAWCIWNLGTAPKTNCAVRDFRPTKSSSQYEKLKSMADQKRWCKISSHHTEISPFNHWHQNWQKVPATYISLTQFHQFGFRLQKGYAVLMALEPYAKCLRLMTSRCRINIACDRRSKGMGKENSGTAKEEGGMIKPLENAKNGQKLAKDTKHAMHR